MLKYPLTKANRIRLARAFQGVPHVDLSIACALEGQMGVAFVDDVAVPTVFKIQVGPFFYFAGDASGGSARIMLENIAPYTLFMPSAPGWIEAGQVLYGERLVGFQRYSFSSTQLSREHLSSLCQSSHFNPYIKHIDLSLATQLWGAEHFIDLSDFDSPDDFVQRGSGFYLEKDSEIIGAAYASLVCSQGVEVSIFVAEEWRREGIATILAGRLLLWCIENNTLAHWDAANFESCKLAEKLGYVQTGSYQAYYLKEA